MREILVGTSGWSYDDWEGPFYPKQIDQARRLNFYADRFPTIEVNFTHYQIPGKSQIAALTNRMHEASLRSVIYKAPRSITHEAIPEEDVEMLRADTSAFFRAMEPAQDAGILDGVLFQFSHSAEPGVVLAGLNDVLTQGIPYPLFVEVRHAGFNEDRHYDALRDRVEPTGGSIVATDSPASTVTAAPPSDEAYFRFHGRNEEMWFVEDPPGEHGSSRYDDLYSEDEIQTLAERVQEAQAGTVHVFFNNHPGAKAPLNAMQLMRELGVPMAKERATLDDFS